MAGLSYPQQRTRGDCVGMSGFALPLTEMRRDSVTRSYRRGFGTHRRRRRSPAVRSRSRNQQRLDVCAARHLGIRRLKVLLQFSLLDKRARNNGVKYLIFLLLNRWRDNPPLEDRFGPLLDLALSSGAAPARPRAAKQVSRYLEGVAQIFGDIGHINLSRSALAQF
jgi:hypothetical protein